VIVPVPAFGSILIFHLFFTIRTAKSNLLAIWQFFLRKAGEPNELAPGTHARTRHERGFGRLAGEYLKFPGGTAAPSRDAGSAALDLLSQTAGMIRAIQDHADESETRARALAERAIEKLHLAEVRVQSAEAARGAAEETLSQLRARLEEAERELTQTQSRNAAAEIQLTNAEQRVKAAEARAISAEKAVNQIENAIRTQLVGLQRNLTRGSARAA
jgi:hypothetical protein